MTPVITYVLLALSVVAPALALPAESVNSTNIDKITQNLAVSPETDTQIYYCSKTNTVALTFDDGPYQYSSELLTYLASQSVPATFFVNGNNYWDITSDANASGIVKQAYDAGHQIGSHTWSHADLNSQTEQAIKDQMTMLDDALISVIGHRPVYMRPPYGNANNTVLEILNGMGYKVVQWSFDSGDSLETFTVDEEFTTVNSQLDSASQHGLIPLFHETIKSTVEELIPRVVAAIKAKGLGFSTVAACLGDDQGAYV